MASGDLVGNFGQRWVIHASVFKTILRHRDGMSAAAPFANQTRTGLEAQAWRCANPTRSSQGLCYGLQLTARRLAEPALFDFLKPVSESKD
jgi:hypothetical protein